MCNRFFEPLALIHAIIVPETVRCRETSHLEIPVRTVLQVLHENADILLIDLTYKVNFYIYSGNADLKNDSHANVNKISYLLFLYSHFL